MNKDIDDYVRQCSICMEKRTGGMVKAPLNKPPIPPRPWHTVAVDLVAMPATKDGFLYAFTAVDLFSRLAAVVPLKSKKSIVVGKNLRNLFETKWLGAPTVLLSDHGGEFDSKIMCRLCKKYGVQQAFSSPYNPKGNGMCERFNKTLIHLLQSVCEKGADWTLKLSAVVEEYNLTPHGSTGCIPLELFLGRPMRQGKLLPDAPSWLMEQCDVSNGGGVKEDSDMDGCTRSLTMETSDDEEIGKGTELKRKEHLQKEREKAVEVMKQTRERSHHQANKDAGIVKLKSGDMVYRRDPKKGPNVATKLDRPFKGPFRVLKVMKNGVAIIAVGRGRPKRVPVGQLKLANEKKKN